MEVSCLVSLPLLAEGVASVLDGALLRLVRDAPAAHTDQGHRGQSAAKQWFDAQHLELFWFTVLIYKYT